MPNLGQKSRTIVFLLICSTCIPCLGQKTTKAKLNFKLLSVHVKGVQQFKEEQVVAASGLKLGQVASESDIQAAMQKLGETGLFSDLTYSYQYSTDGCAVEFRVAENTELVPIIFDNLVWFSDDELISQLNARVPLFNGRLPIGGNLADQVAESLNALLAERKIPGKADYLRATTGESGPITSYIYKIAFHPVTIRNLSFPGADQAEISALQNAGKSLLGQDYLRTKMSPQEKYNFLPVYLSRGFLQASFSAPAAIVVQDGPTTTVDVSFPVNPGRQYTLAAIQWHGNSVLPVEKLQAMVHLKPGEPADAVQLNNDLEAVQKLYGTKGYLFTHVQPAPTLDEARATVAYELDVNEGDLYRMADLELDGLDADATAKMAAQWQMKKGDPFDNSYLSKFFSVMYRDVGLRHPYKVVPKQSVNQQDKTVSVALHFMPK